MNFKTFYLTEMPMYSDEPVQSSNFVINGRYNKAKSDKKKFKEMFYKKYKILQTTNYTKSSLEWFVFINDELVANFSSDFGLDKKLKFPIITLSLVSPEHMKQNIATEFYNYLIEKYGGVISSRFLSKDGGMLLWNSLIKKFNSYKLTSDNKIEKINSMPESDDTTRFIISKKDLL